MSKPTISHAVSGVILAMLLASCGSTATVNTGGRTEQSGDGTQSDGLEQPAPGVDGPAGVVAGDPNSIGSGTGSGAFAGQPGARAPDGTGSTGGSAQLPGRPPGATDTKIRIGIPLADDLDQAARLGATLTGPTVDDAERAIRAVFADVNARGGAVGRKFEPLFLRVKYLTSERFDNEAQQTCSHFTEDNKVFAVVMGMNNSSTLLPSCLAKARTVMIDGSNSRYFDDQTVKPFGRYYYRPPLIGFDKWTAYIDGLVAGGLLKPGNKIGLARIDVPDQDRTVAKVIRPALAKHGLKLTDEFAFSYVNSVSEVSQNSAESSNAVLQFRSQDIDRVIFLATQSTTPYTFMTTAEQQQYRPRYGISSADLPMYLSNNVPAAQLHGARGVGWNRPADVPPQKWPDSAEYVRCAKIMAKAGFIDSIFGFGCDAIWFLQISLNRAGAVSPEALRTAVDGLGTSFRYASGFGMRFTPGRTTAGNGVRQLAFDDECVCFRYSSPTRTLS